MCGICGFTGSPESRVLDNMISSLVHRGPDGKGKVELNNVSLGMRRLAIIDLERGGQPVFNSDKSIVAVFNGEIYNHIELRKELEKKGCRFRSSHSDSEVIVHLYQEFGVSFLNKLNGMFAIALWDKNKDMLLLARDRAGVKPLYFGKFSNRLIFGSEIKSILLHPLVKKSPNFPAIYHFFSFKNIPAPHTAFENIEQLGPGEILTVTGANIRREKWWSLKFHENTELCEEEASTELYNLLEDSVKIRMRSDVEFGAYLSGGVDSSSVVALMSRATNEKIKTFSLVYPNEFPGKMLDQECAQEISSIYDTVHYEVCLQPNEIISSLNDVIKSFDEPYSGVTSTYFLTELISKHVKVAISRIWFYLFPLRMRLLVPNRVFS